MNARTIQEMLRGVAILDPNHPGLAEVEHVEQLPGGLLLPCFTDDGGALSVGTLLNPTGIPLTEIYRHEVQAILEYDGLGSRVVVGWQHDRYDFAVEGEGQAAPGFAAIAGEWVKTSWPEHVVRQAEEQSPGRPWTGSRVMPGGVVISPPSGGDVTGTVSWTCEVGSDTFRARITAGGEAWLEDLDFALTQLPDGLAGRLGIAQAAEKDPRDFEMWIPVDGFKVTCEVRPWRPMTPRATPARHAR